MLNPGSRWCNSRPVRFNTWERTPGTNYTGRSVNSRANLDVMGKKKSLARTRIRIPDGPARTAVTIQTMLPTFRHKL
jgi:hypothetical protein